MGEISTSKRFIDKMNGEELKLFKKLLITLPLATIVLLGLPQQEVGAMNAYTDYGNKELVQEIQPFNSTVFSGNTSVGGLNTRSFTPVRFGYTANWTEGNGGDQRNYTSLTIRTNAAGAQSTSRVNAFTSSKGAQRNVRGNSNSQNHHISFRTGMRQNAFGAWVIGYSTSISGRVDF